MNSSEDNYNRIPPALHNCVKGSKIFISYSSSDREFANKLSSDLQRNGFLVWFDQWEIRVGDCKLTKMSQGLRDSQYVILILSKAAVSSKWVEKEWKTAYWEEVQNKSVKLLPVLKSDCDIPFFLNSLKCADFREKYSQAFSELMNALGELDRASKKQKKKIWYIDDNKYWLDVFKARHKDTFDITCFTSSVELLDQIEALEEDDNLCPDILLVDLYTPKNLSESDCQMGRPELDETNKKAVKMFKMEKALKAYVDDAWEPNGVEIVNYVRQYYSAKELPVTLYTQRGLVVLEDDLIMELELLGTSWLLKNQFSRETERMMLDKQMRNGIHSNRPGPKQILFIDDDPKFHNAFIARHQSAYDIECTTDQSKVLSILERMKSEGRFPNILLVDLYYPKKNKDNAKIDLANIKLAEFQEFETEVKKLVKNNYEPNGRWVINQIRNLPCGKSLPILVYTQFGLLLLDDSNIRKIESLNAGWLLKDRYSIRTEQIIIMGAIQNAKTRANQNNRP